MRSAGRRLPGKVPPPPARPNANAHSAPGPALVRLSGRILLRRRASFGRTEMCRAEAPRPADTAPLRGNVPALRPAAGETFPAGKISPSWRESAARRVPARAGRWWRSRAPTTLPYAYAAVVHFAYPAPVELKTGLGLAEQLARGQTRSHRIGHPCDDGGRVKSEDRGPGQSWRNRRGPCVGPSSFREQGLTRALDRRRLRGEPATHVRH